MLSLAGDDEATTDAVGACDIVRTIHNGDKRARVFRDSAWHTILLVPVSPSSPDGSDVQVQHRALGVDGTRRGWVWVSASGSDVTCGVAPSAADLYALASPTTWVSIDVPIGLPRRGPRRCDVLARAFLGSPRSASVFSAPVRSVLEARDHADACRLHRAADGRAISLQAFHLLPKIRDVDAVLREADASGVALAWAEVHPEVSFARWNDGRPMTYAKRTTEGRAERRALIDDRWPGAFGACRARLRGHGVAYDDLLDAFAAAWSAERRRDGRAVTLPTIPEIDDVGRRMEIVT